MGVAERLLIQIPEQMERFDADIRSVDGALQQRPEVLQAVRMDSPVDVLDSMVYDLMDIVWRQLLFPASNM
jgi:hypothetical protein